MDLFLAIVGWTLFGLAAVVGLALDVVGLSGNWVILGAVLVGGLVTKFEHFGGWCIPVLVCLAVLGEVVEAAAAGYGAKRFGGGRGAFVAALAGCIAGGIIGSPWFPILGTLAGALLGAFVGATLYELVITRRATNQAMWAGVGAALGKVGGLFAKLLVGFVMLIAAVVFY